MTYSVLCYPVKYSNTVFLYYNIYCIYFHLYVTKMVCARQYAEVFLTSHAHKVSRRNRACHKAVYGRIAGLNTVIVSVSCCGEIPVGYQIMYSLFDPDNALLVIAES